MSLLRQLPLEDRIKIYIEDRVNNQAEWYSKKALFNKQRGKLWFCVSVTLHVIAILLLLYRIYNPIIELPIEVIATAASAVLTWLQSNKHNELNSSYALAAHEIVLIKAEVFLVSDQTSFSEYVINSEAAFSREHTQWTARKIE